MKKNDFGTIFTSNDIMNIQYRIGKVFGSRESFGHRKKIPHEKPN